MCTRHEMNLKVYTLRNGPKSFELMLRLKVECRATIVARLAVLYLSRNSCEKLFKKAKYLSKALTHRASNDFEITSQCTQRESRIFVTIYHVARQPLVLSNNQSLRLYHTICRCCCWMPVDQKLRTNGGPCRAAQILSNIPIQVDSLHQHPRIRRSSQ